MLETPHVVVGAAIAVKVVNPALAVPIAFTSHFILDSILHWNPHTYTETMKHGRPTNRSLSIAFVDAAAALVIGSAIALSQLPNIALVATVFICCFAAVLSDVIKSPFYLFKKNKGLIKKWVDLERKIQVETPNAFLGISIQLVIIAASLIWMYT